MRNYKRVCALILVVILAVAFNGCFAFMDIPLKDLFSRSTEAPIFEEPTAADAEFDAFINELFVYDMEGDYLNIHFYFEHPEDYGIDAASAVVGFGAGYDEAADDADRAEIEKFQKRLAAFERDALSADRQDTYDMLQYDLQMRLALSEEPFRYYGSAFGTATGVHISIPQTLADFVLRGEQDAADLVTLVESVGEYIDGALEYTKKQAEEGTLMLAFEEVTAYCQDILDAGAGGDILLAMQANVDSLGLEEGKAAAYKQQLSDAYTASFLPAYQRIVDTLASLEGAPNNTLGLAALPQGKKFYEALFAQATSSSRSIEETKALLYGILTEYGADLQDAIAQNPKAADEWIAGNATTGYTDFTSMLNDLEAFSKQSFPDIGDVAYEIEPTVEGAVSDSVAAYYWMPALDATTPQQIRVNMSGNLDTGGIGTFKTVAHEGFPGHLYQNTYAYTHLDDPYRKIDSSFPGYSEGYATYAEMLSYDYLTHIDEGVRRIDRDNEIYTYAALCLADIGIHYEGWTLEETMQFFEDYGLGISAQGAAAQYSQLQQNPTIFLPYHVGFAEFMALRKEAEDALGRSFSEIDFHEAILKSGNAPFEIVRRNVEDYIAQAGGKRFTLPDAA